jgi:hypothetical protein
MKSTPEIEKEVYKLRCLLATRDEKLKMDLYWGLLEECMDKDCENAGYVGELWTIYLSRKIELIDKRKRELTPS